MAALRTIRDRVLVGVLAIAAATTAIAKTDSVPTVYEDEYITVRAGIAEVGLQPVHLGDALSLIIDVAFNSGQVQIENLNEDVFQRAFAGTPSIRLYQPAEVVTQTAGGDRVRVVGLWRLQILDCPEDMTSCPGSNSYALPIMTISYQLVDGVAGSTDSRSARFRPWPGAIAVAPGIAAIHGPDAELAEVLPGGAYAEPEPVGRLAATGLPLLIGGALLFATGFIAAMRERHPMRVTVRPHHTSRRWEHALEELRKNTLPDDEWSDLLRRAITWYCMDELGRNPYTWLGAAASDSAIEDHSAPHDFFIDVLHRESIDREQRKKYLDTLLRITGQAQNTDVPEQSA